MITVTNIIYYENHTQLELDTGERLKLPLSTPGISSLSSGHLIDTTTYDHLKDEAEHYECYSKALSYLAIRERSQQEMKIYLRKKQFSDQVISKILNHLREKNYLNDYRFSESYINSIRHKKAIGKNLLKKKLLQKGVDRKVANKAIRNLNADIVDFDQLYEIAEKKYQSLIGKKNLFSKLNYFLYQRGYDGEDIKKVLQKLKKKHEDPDLFNDDTF